MGCGCRSWGKAEGHTSPLSELRRGTCSNLVRKGTGGKPITGAITPGQGLPSCGWIP
jgi:hypothetical protein